LPPGQDGISLVIENEVTLIGEGHVGHPENDRVDGLANGEAQKSAKS
jgi:ribonuclease HI